MNVTELKTDELEMLIGLKLEQLIYNPIGSYQDVKIRFGKYKGYSLYDIPLSYLDKTIGSMPSSWIVRTVQKFVDACMRLLLAEYGDDYFTQLPPNKAWSEFQKEIEKQREVPSLNELDPL